MKGTQIIASFINCKHQMMLIDKYKFKIEISNCIAKSRLTEVGNKIYKFKNQGITGVFLLAEYSIKIIKVYLYKLVLILVNYIDDCILMDILEVLIIRGLEMKLFV